MPILGCREHPLLVDFKEVSAKVVFLSQQRLVNMSVQKSLVWRSPELLNPFFPHGFSFGVEELGGHSEMISVNYKS